MTIVSGNPTAHFPTDQIQQLTICNINTRKKPPKYVNEEVSGILEQDFYVALRPICPECCRMPSAVRFLSFNNRKATSHKNVGLSLRYECGDCRFRFSLFRTARTAKSNGGSEEDDEENGVQKRNATDPLPTPAAPAQLMLKRMRRQFCSDSQVQKQKLQQQIHGNDFEPVINNINANNNYRQEMINNLQSHFDGPMINSNRNIFNPQGMFVNAQNDFTVPVMNRANNVRQGLARNMPSNAGAGAVNFINHNNPLINIKNNQYRNNPNPVVPLQIQRPAMIAQRDIATTPLPISPASMDLSPLNASRHFSGNGTATYVNPMVRIQPVGNQNQNSVGLNYDQNSVLQIQQLQQNISNHHHHHHHNDNDRRNNFITVNGSTVDVQQLDNQFDMIKNGCSPDHSGTQLQPNGQIGLLVNGDNDFEAHLNNGFIGVPDCSPPIPVHPAPACTANILAGPHNGNAGTDNITVDHLIAVTAVDKPANINYEPPAVINEHIKNADVTSPDGGGINNNANDLSFDGNNNSVVDNVDGPVPGSEHSNPDHINTAATSEIVKAEETVLNNVADTKTNIILDMEIDWSNAVTSSYVAFNPVDDDDGPFQQSVDLWMF